MQVRDAHDLCDAIEASVMESFPGAHVTLHVEPESERRHVD